MENIRVMLFENDQSYRLLGFHCVKANSAVHYRFEKKEVTLLEGERLE